MASARRDGRASPTTAVPLLLCRQAIGIGTHLSKGMTHGRGKVVAGRATGSININITEIKELGEEWDSDTLTSVYSKLASESTSANVGDIRGNRMFFANDYMASRYPVAKDASLTILIQVQRGPGYLTSVRMYSNRTRNTECTNNQNVCRVNSQPVLILSPSTAARFPFVRWDHVHVLAR